MEEKDKWGLNWDVWTNGKFQCVYCGFNGMSSILVAHQMVVDHVRPRCRDGRDDKDNLVVACCACNPIKAEWDRSVYDPAKFENVLAVAVRQSAKNYIDSWYQKWNPGYLEMMKRAG
jgi:5-methylcytosine-specific restriction endonuclease McrA